MYQSLEKTCSSTQEILETLSSIKFSVVGIVSSEILKYLMQGVFTEEIFRQLFMTIDSLPERCKQVFLLHMEGKKNEEIAAALYVSLETVKTQKKRAMSLLRKKLSPYHFALLLSILP